MKSGSLTHKGLHLISFLETPTEFLKLESCRQDDPKVSAFQVICQQLEEVRLVCNHADGLLLLHDLGMGTILAIFQSFGNLPLDKLKSLVKEGAMFLAVLLSMHVCRDVIRTACLSYIQILEKMKNLFF